MGLHFVTGLVRRLWALVPWQKKKVNL